MSFPTKSQTLEQFYKQLNENQRQAVQNFNGPVLVLAGAGSGKTRVLVYRITALILQGHARLENILAVTFTNKAAKEMKERVAELLSLYSHPYTWTPWIGTFHSVCAGILRQNIPLLKNRTTVTIYDQGDQLSLIKKVLKDLNIDPKMKEPKSIRSQINLCKRMALGPEELHRISYLSYDKQFELIYLTYEKALKKAGAFDFESLLLETYKLMLKHPEFLNSLQNQFRYICVDEYQDTNHIQYLLIKKLAEKHQNITVVGDEDQSIYSWRGADMKNIMDFEKDFKQCKTFFLEENYRSSKNIVLGANGLIAHNKIRKGKSLIAQKSAGHKIHIRETHNDYEEGQFVAQSIRSFCANEGGNWGDFAVLYRTNAQSRILEDHLRVLRVPYKIVGGVRFYERKEIKIALSYLKLILNSEDDVSFLNAINEPRRGIGKIAIDKLQQQALKTKKSLYECLKESVNQKTIKGKALREVIKFIQGIEELKNQKDKISLCELYSLLLNKSGYLESLELQNSIEAQSRIENLQELGNVIEQKEKQLNGGFLNLESFLEEMSLLSQEDKTKDGKDFVTLMTLHNSKGLEFHSVFITGLEEGLFPSFQSIEDNNLEEERRLAYVGMTRAKERLTLSFAKKRKFWGREQYNPLSSFLSEISQELIFQESVSLYKNPEFESDY
ncbi:MAG: UvrD-helicase domain-containing protein [Oligoflexia bacterium]|nr:UvrD-helicase domain-containing protein [Oligoflexia bacterium]